MSAGTGRGTITEDSCPVEVYLRFPAMGEGDLVHEEIATGASVLDLGCGTGRITHQLIALGHPVTAVDSSADMLAHVRGARTVHEASDGHIGDVPTDLEDVRRDGSVVTATIRYWDGARTESWTQTFAARELGDDELADTLAAVGLRLLGRRSPDGAWFVAGMAAPAGRLS